MITSYAQQVVSTLLRFVPLTPRNQSRAVSSQPDADPMQLAFMALQGRCEAESLDEARRMLMNEYVKQLSATNNNTTRLNFWRRRRVRQESLGRQTALAAYKQTKLYAEQLVAGRLI